MVEFLKYKRQLEEDSGVKKPDNDENDYGVVVIIIFGVLAAVVIIGTVIANIYLSK